MSATAARRNLATSHAEAAKCIKRELRAAFPTVDFRVKSKSFSMGNSVDVYWTDGPTTGQVDRIIGKYQYGHFDGMVDLYEYSNRRDDLPQAKYVMANREYSRAAYCAMVDELNAEHGWSLEVEPAYNGIKPASDGWREYAGGMNSHEIHRSLYHLPLLCAKCGTHTLPDQGICPSCGAALPESDGL